MTDKIHIVCLDAPSPPDYGGAIDMYCKIKALGEAGCQVILHYFNYNDRTAEGLQPYCSEIHSYKRSGPIKSFFGKLPYIVSSRVNQELINRLNSDDVPVLLEGIHCTGIIPYLNRNKKVLIRVHNQESVYYQKLALPERNPFKRFYFRRESKRLKDYEKSLSSGADLSFACLSENDLEFFQYQYPKFRSFLVPAFIPWKTDIKPGKGSYCLYHGNLSVSENEEAAVWLLQHVFSRVAIPFIIAGKDATNHLKQKAAAYRHVRVISDPGFKELDDLIQNAQINLIHSLNETGIKLKLIHTLLRGRFCIANAEAVQGSNIGPGVFIANSPDAYLEQIGQLMSIPFTENEVTERLYIADLFNNRKNAEKLISFL